MMKTLVVTSSQREEFIDVTPLIETAVAESGVTEGVAVCFVPHTTAGITVNEAADPDVRHDLLNKLAREIPRVDGYRHAEGNSDAHLKASLMGCSLQLLVQAGRPVLGRWQGVYFCEFDGPRSRQLVVKVGRFD
jgi:secondary thiamine-phosphate synthase enzyme